MLTILPYMRHFDEELQCAPNEIPEFYRVFEGVEGSEAWVADFAAKAEAEAFVNFKQTT
ncbi:hypothetical protein [Paraburkholderia sediminicola]|uniref:hypothetical protein n=1 Tax=Paraburkholderia sediminicola TaxID=458836 RepID=UPI0038BA63B8